jgi:hypothetical protein
MTPRESETDLSPASLPGVNFDIAVVLLCVFLRFICTKPFYTVENDVDPPDLISGGMPMFQHRDTGTGLVTIGS